ncbi:MAG: permease-like cell division protein FtsX [Slackia sp.]|uniref:permease-like cell division protein FtsX n=1 Tax=uncultured Slackia sp. TaxID=665903 RepID=UPI002803B02E|nr:permease-like cell division protein FtsX [uncultured Slackia sp.]MDU6011859.1 permease-like cell division protein FtsX [Slackia sp.]
MSSLFYFFKESLTGFSRNLSTTLGSIITIFLSLLIIGVFLVGGGIVDNIVSSVEDKVSVTAYVSDDANQNDINAVMKTIEGISGVQSVGFTTKDEAMENFSNSMSSNPEIVEQLDGMNPLPASIDIELSDAQQVESVVGAIASNASFKEICDSPDDPSDSLKYGGQETIERLFSVTNYVRYIGVALIALLVFIALVFINNTIRLAILARSREISIMRLVGASNGFIRGPFLMEGALHALIGAGLAIVFLEILRRVALPQVSTALMWLPIALSSVTYARIYLTLVVAGLIIAAVGSMFAMRRYLKV